MRGSLTARAAAAVALLAVLIIGGFVLLIGGIQRLGSAQTSSDQALAVVSAGGMLENRVLDMQSAVRGFAETGTRARCRLTGPPSPRTRGRHGRWSG